MITKMQFRILNTFSKNIYKSYSFKEINDAYKSKSKGIVPSYLKKMVEEKILKKERISNVGIYKLNLDNPKVFSYLYPIFWENLPKIAELPIRYIIESAEKKESFYSLVVFGSYAKGKNKKGSDLDIAIFIPESSDKKPIEKELSDAKLKSLLDMDIHIIKKDEFLEMLLADYENLGKEIARKNLPLHNIDIFYSMINKGRKNGFNI